MANSELKHKMFPTPQRVLHNLSVALKKYPNENESKGYSRARFILDQKSCSYEQLKRIKNYFDYIDPDNYNLTEYELNGGEEMRRWVDHTLERARESVRKTKHAKNDVGFQDQFGKEKDTQLAKPRTSKIMEPPDILFNSKELVSEITKIKTLIKKII